MSGNNNHRSHGHYNQHYQGRAAHNQSGTGWPFNLTNGAGDGGTATSGAPNSVPQIAHLGLPETYRNFGLDSFHRPMPCTLALVAIPSNMDPAAAVAAGCQMMVLGFGPALPPMVPTNAGHLPYPGYFDLGLPQGFMLPTPPPTPMMHMPPPPQMLLNPLMDTTPSARFANNSPGTPGTSEGPSPFSTPGRLNPLAEVFVPSNFNGGENEEDV